MSEITTKDIVRIKAALEQEKYILDIDKQSIQKLLDYYIDSQKSQKKSLPPQLRNDKQTEICEFLDRCKGLSDLCCQIMDTDGLTDEAYEYAESVDEKSNGILETVEHTNVVTDAQIQAIQNMGAGARKWLRE